MVKIARKLGISDTLLVQVALRDMLKRKSLTISVAACAEIRSDGRSCDLIHSETLLSATSIRLSKLLTRHIITD
jgi:hypothetical protein